MVPFISQAPLSVCLCPEGRAVYGQFHQLSFTSSLPFAILPIVFLNNGSKQSIKMEMTVMQLISYLCWNCQQGEGVDNCLSKRINSTFQVDTHSYLRVVATCLILLKFFFSFSCFLPLVLKKWIFVLFIFLKARHFLFMHFFADILHIFRHFNLYFLTCIIYILTLKYETLLL